MFDVRESTWRSVPVECDCEELAVLDPEVAVEPCLEVSRLALQLIGEFRVIPDQTRQSGTTHLRVVRISLQLAGRARESGQSAVVIRDGIPRVLPALVLQPRRFVATLVRHVAITLQVGVGVDPVQRGSGLIFQVAHKLNVARPALVLVEEHEIQGRRVGTAVVGRMRPLLKGCHLPVPHLMQDPAGIFIAEVVESGALTQAQFSERGRC